MSDNVAITPGSGVTIRTLDNGSGYQKQLVALDVAGESAESIVTNTNQLPVINYAQTPSDTNTLLQTDTAGNLFVSSMTSLTVHEELDPENSNDVSRTLMHEREQALTPFRETLTLDTNLERVLGSQRLLDPTTGRLMVSDQPAPELVVSGTMATINKEVRISLSGQGTVTVNIYGTWSGVVSFSASTDGQNWPAITGEALSSTIGTTPSTSASANGLWRFRTSGLTGFRVQFTTATSGIVYAQLTATPIVFPVSSPTVQPLGSNSQSLVQKVTSNELQTYDTSTAPSTGLLQNVFTNIDPWYTKGVYNVGDACLWNGQMYQCILSTSGITPPPYPSNGTYWQVDQRQSKSVIAIVPLAPPSAARVRVEIDLDEYQYRLAESHLIYAQILAQNEMMFQSYLLNIEGSGVNGQQGQAFSMGESSSSYYVMEEIR